MYMLQKINSGNKFALTDHRATVSYQKKMNMSKK